MVSPTRRRDAASYLQRRHKVSERRACRVVNLHRSTKRYRAVPGDFELRLVKRMNALADQHPRYGYRMIWKLLRTEGWAVNRKRIERLWRLEGHRVPPRRSKSSGARAQGTASSALWALPASAQNDVWSYDFMSVRTRSGAPIRILNVVDEFTRVCVGSRVAPSIGARQVRVYLQEMFGEHGKPKHIRSDNGREFVAAELTSWLTSQGVTCWFIEKGRPQQNAFVERFNGTMRNETLAGEEFNNVLEARVVLAEWVAEYNARRPHRGLGMRTPLQFAASCEKGGT